MKVEYAGCLPTVSPFKDAVAVYELLDSRSDTPFYVGISTDPVRRYREHLSKNSHTNYGIDQQVGEIQASGCVVKMRVIGWYSSDMVSAVEKLEIARRVHAGFDLVNISGHPHHDVDYVALANELLTQVEEIIGPDTV